MNGHLNRTTDVPLAGGKLPLLAGFEPTVVKGKWFEVNELNHSAIFNNRIRSHKVFFHYALLFLQEKEILYI
jgi:hypothetical protein